jgi:hypothetical protein
MIRFLFSDLQADTDAKWFGLLWFGGGALVGAGIFGPFHKHWFGAVFGMAVMGLLFYVFTYFTSL